nr:type I-E CRISPR-associated protein Cas6/Cse3/CasE [Streptomyces himalayensis]
MPDSYGTVETRDLTPMLRALTPGRHLRYRITANASRRVCDKDPSGGSKHGKVVALYGNDALVWWQRRAAAAGLALTATDTTPVPFARRNPNSHTKGTRNEKTPGPVMS